ncbi:hypothetical protein DL990_04400 [Amycolatopsis sp. WAC 01416]|nr:hypothetical protein DL990_04400 [Amycolatopsis sp. WAC 01416]
MSVTQWIRYFWADDDTVTFLEIDEDGWARRQVILQGELRLPVSAATLDEVMHLRDHGTLADMTAYEDRYGVLAEGDVRDWEDTDQVVEITRAEFDQAWVPARETLDNRV